MNAHGSSVLLTSSFCFISRSTYRLWGRCCHPLPHLSSYISLPEFGYNLIFTDFWTSGKMFIVKRFYCELTVLALHRCRLAQLTRVMSLYNRYPISIV